jgi:hypothetical protein
MGLTTLDINHKPGHGKKFAILDAGGRHPGPWWGNFSSRSSFPPSAGMFRHAPTRDAGKP